MRLAAIKLSECTTTEKSWEWDLNPWSYHCNWTQVTEHQTLCLWSNLFGCKKWEHLPPPLLCPCSNFLYQVRRWEMKWFAEGGHKGFLGGEWRTQWFKEYFKKFCLMETSPFSKYIFFLNVLWNWICFMVVFKFCF